MERWRGWMRGKQKTRNWKLESRNEERELGFCRRMMGGWRHGEPHDHDSAGPADGAGV
jgi:hypothetical protein